MNESDILSAFHLRRFHYDTYLQANELPFHTCPGCAFPSLTTRGEFESCIICTWEDDGHDDHATGVFLELHLEGIPLTTSNGTLTETRINIGRILETAIDLIDGETDFDTARVLKNIAFYKQRKQEIADRITGEEFRQDHIWIEWNEIKKDLLQALVVPKNP